MNHNNQTHREEGRDPHSLSVLTHTARGAEGPPGLRGFTSGVTYSMSRPEKSTLRATKGTWCSQHQPYSIASYTHMGTTCLPAGLPARTTVGEESELSPRHRRPPKWEDQCQVVLGLHKERQRPLPQTLPPHHQVWPRGGQAWWV